MAHPLITLSSYQAQIVEAPLGGSIRVLASAGSGKTRVLTERIRFIMQTTKKDGVIAITFTNKAAEEMKGRLEGLDESNERLWVTTIHSLCQRIIDQYGHAIGLPSDLHIYEREQDRKTIFMQALRERGMDLTSLATTGRISSSKDQEKAIQRYLDRFSTVKRNLLSDQEIKDCFPDDDTFLRIFKAYQDALLLSGGMDFDDILVFAVRILLEQSWCAQIYGTKYKHICIDEAQDLNRAQYEFIKPFCGNDIRSILMVGDTNQMIYGFNGSSHSYLCESFLTDFSPQTFRLNENYRSSKAVVNIANKLKPGSQVESNYAKTGIVNIEAFDDEDSEAEWICNKIQSLLQMRIDSSGEIEGDIGLENMVILARNRFAFKAIEKKLHENNISYYLKKGERHAEPISIFGNVLDLGIRLRLNPKDWVDGKKLFSILKVQFPDGWGDEYQLETLANSMPSEAIAFSSLQSDLLRGIQRLDLDEPNIPKLCAVFEERIKRLGVDPTVGNPDELELSLLELKDFRELWTTFRRRGLGETLGAFRNAIALGQLFDSSSQYGLTLSSVHTMKGLEKDIVFLAGMCEGVFPDYRASTPVELEEELNNAFVAMTRSRRWLFITYPRSRTMPWGGRKLQQPSRFLTQIQTS